MRLENYLDSLKVCPDEQLKDELGIYDNWPIFLNADFENIIRYLKESENYEQIESKITNKTFFNYIPGTVEMQVFNWIPDHSTTGFGCNNTKEEQIESKRQLNNYSTTIILHPYQEKKIEGVHQLRALAIVATDIGEYAIKEGIPICMPRTIGWKHYDKNDTYSRIVYHEPKIK